MSWRDEVLSPEDRAREIAEQLPLPTSAQLDLLRRVLRPHLTSGQPARAPTRDRSRAA